MDNIPDNKKKENSPYDKQHFTYDAIKDEYTCPAGQPVTFLGEHYMINPKRKLHEYIRDKNVRLAFIKKCARGKERG